MGHPFGGLKSSKPLLGPGQTVLNKGPGCKRARAGDTLERLYSSSHSHESICSVHDN